VRITEPLLAAKFDPKNAKQLAIVKAHLPLLASFKLDGVRAIGQGDTLLSRTFKPIPNTHVRELFSGDWNYDGELIFGDPTDALCYNKTVSAVMSVDGRPDVRWYVFDDFRDDVPFEDRLRLMGNGRHMPANVIKLPQHLCKTWDDVLTYENHALTLGYEGLILRAPSGRYKQGRSTLREGFAIKLKRFVDSEALVQGVIELQHNNNEQKINEVGKLKRSTNQEGKSAGGTMGALMVRDIETGVEFELGTGFTAEARQWWWDNRARATGMVVKYKYFPIGVKEKPRHPVFLGVRAVGDMPK
jgi:DNA ligase-1